MEEQYVPKPDSHLALAIICTVLCCLPLGIVGIVKASKVDSYYLAKQYDAAKQASDDAKKWSFIGMGLGLAGGIIYIIVVLIGVFAGAGSY